MKFPALFLHALILFGFIFYPPAILEAAEGRRGMVVTPDSRATETALQVLRGGGNAVDALIAAQGVLGVVDPASSGLGGGALLLFYEAGTGRIYAYDGSEQAPADASPGMFSDKSGKPYPYREKITGGLAAGVPGTLKLLKTVHERFGGRTFSFSKLLDPAVRLAEGGCLISDKTATLIAGHRDRLNRFETSRRIFINMNGKPKMAGEVLFQIELAQTLRLIQRDGAGIFYEGEIAQDLVQAVRRSDFHPGIMKKEDPFYYQVAEHDPAHGTYRGYDVFTFGPPSSGGPVLIEALNILDHFKLEPWKRHPESLFIFFQAQRLAWTDAAQAALKEGAGAWDRMLDREFAKERAGGISGQAGVQTQEVGREILPGPDEETGGIFILIADGEGNVAAYTASLGPPFGSALAVDRRGFLLNGRLAGFEIEGAAGELASGRRLTAGMVPVFIFYQGKPFLATASAAGFASAGAVLNLLVNQIDFKQPLEKAMAAPRAVGRGEIVEAESALRGSRLADDFFRKKGLEIREMTAAAAAGAVYLETSRSRVFGQCDLRGECAAAGY